MTMTNTSQTDVAPAAPTGQSTLKTILGTGVGNALEWYDWGVYAIFTPFFATQFFDKAHPVSAVLSTLAVFAVGFVARPFGGFVFGWIADHTGRRFAMSATVGTAAIGSIVIGVSPTYESVGAFASLILVLARLLQGLSVGGEFGSSAAYLSEVSTPKRRGFFSSCAFAGSQERAAGGVRLT